MQIEYLKLTQLRKPIIRESFTFESLDMGWHFYKESLAVQPVRL